MPAFTRNAFSWHLGNLLSFYALIRCLCLRLPDPPALCLSCICLPSRCSSLPPSRLYLCEWSIKYQQGEQNKRQRKSMAVVFPLNISRLSDASAVVLSRFQWCVEHNANQLRNERDRSRGADLRLLLTAHRGGEIREDKDIRNEENPERALGCCWGESFWLLSRPLPHWSSPPCLFYLGGGGGLRHNASASGGSSNTLLWPKYSSVVRWLAKRRSRSGGGGWGWAGMELPPPPYRRRHL